MKVDVTFVNFPASHRFQKLVAERIEEHVARFGERVQSVRAIFSAENFKHHLRLNVNGSHLKVTVEAADPDVGHTVDKAIDKLCGAMRKKSGRRKDRFHAHNVEPQAENAFDRFEKEFVREFDDQFDKTG